MPVCFFLTNTLFRAPQRTEDQRTEDQTESIRPRVKHRTLGGKLSLEEKILHSPFPVHRERTTKA